MAFVTLITVFLVAAAIATVTKKQRVIEFSSLTASGISFIMSLIIAYKVGTYGSFSVLWNLFTVDSLSALGTLIVSTIAFFASLYAMPYFRKEQQKNIIGSMRIRKYYGQINIFVAAALLATSADNPIMAWIFLEATTLATAFLISYYDKRSAIEAAWKYLIINAIGLLLAFLGALLYLTISTNSEQIMTWQQLVANATSLNPAVAKIAFAFVLVGYGVKIGFAPMHVWKPDTYSKSPAPLGALFSGALLPVAFSLLLRFKLITDTAIGSSFSDMLLMIFGAVSIFVAAFCIFTTHNYKRTLAYSSIEHAGIMALGFSFGGIGALAAVMHMLYHSLIKPALFFATGNILIKYHSARIARVSGTMSIIPITTILLFAGLFAVTGLPPFGMFLTEVSIAAVGLQVHPAITIGAMLLIAIIFVGFFRQISAMALSAKPDDETIHQGESSAWLLVSPAALLTLSLIATFYLPPFLLTLINEVATRF